MFSSLQSPDWFWGPIPGIYKYLVRISQEAHYVSAKDPNRSMLFKETVAVYCGSRSEHTNKFREQRVLKLVVHIATTGLQMFSFRHS
jgi:hypothetical protein